MNSFSFSVGVTPKAGINMTEGATIGLGMKLNIEGRHFKPNEKVKSYEVQPHVKSFKVPKEFLSKIYYKNACFISLCRFHLRRISLKELWNCMSRRQIQKINLLTSLSDLKFT